MEINFERKYVHCFWDDDFTGKKGFVADNILELRESVKNNDASHFISVKYSNSERFPFADANKEFADNRFLFFYYDPNYEVKRAWLEGKDLQYVTYSAGWVDFPFNDKTDVNSISWDNNEWRIKPTEEYVPFETIDELIEAWEEKYPSCKDRLEGTEPLIWIRPKRYNIKYLIDCFNRDSNSVAIYRQSINLQTLFDNWLFADVTVCGKRNDK